MAINKVIYQDSNEEFMKAVERNGEAMVSLLNFDRGVKAAASNLISKDLLEKYRPTDDHTACIHLIAMGSSDQYGFNKNGDWFSGDVLEKTAHTFVTNGHMFREHRNKDPKQAIGRIKYAGYDPKGMQRVELIVHMDKDKAQEEYEMAKNGSALSFSMSCRVPNDRCSICGNKAKAINNYCDHLKYNMGRWIEKESNYAYAYNDEPVFFDISRVANPADRIARQLEYVFKDDSDSLKKAAGDYDNIIIPSAVAAQYEGINLNTMNIEEMSMLSKLASSESYIKEINKFPFVGDARGYACRTIYPFSMMEKFSKQELDTVREANPGTLFNKLAKRACMLSFPAFSQYITGEENICESPVFKMTAIKLPGIFNNTFRQANTLTSIADEFSASDDYMCSQDPKSDDIQNLMDDLEDKFSLNPSVMHGRVLRITISIDSDNEQAIRQNLKDKLLKSASYSISERVCDDLAKAYCQYQVRALCDINNLFENGVSDNMLDTVAGANTVLIFDR